MNQTWENGKKKPKKKNAHTHNLGPNFASHLGPSKFFLEFYLYLMLDIAASYHDMQFKGKLMNQPWEIGKKSNFRPNFGLLDPN